MPITFACTCGKQFRVAMELAGKKSRCPACQQPLQIPAAEPAPPPPPATPGDSLPGISFACSCGKLLRAKAELAGRKTRCPGCQTPLVIPAPPAEEPEPDYEPYEEDEPAHTSSDSADDEPPVAPAGGEDYEPYEEDEPASPAFEPFEARAEMPASRLPPTMPERYRNLPTEPPGTSLQEYFYWGLLLFFIPLGLSLVIWADDSPVDRLHRTLENAPDETLERIAAIEERVERRQEQERERRARGFETDEEEPGMTAAEHDELIAALPGGRIEGAHLPRKTLVHWLYALGSMAIFLGLSLFLFPQAGQPLHLFLIGLFTGTIGIVLLLTVQIVAENLQGLGPPRGHIVYMLIYWVIFMIGFSYRAALDPDTSFIGSLLGFTFGVGLCEEFVKALPLLFYFRRPGQIGWREACTWGFASGAGFGVAEGIMYSADFYNGYSTFGIYLVRFLSCVALHAIWTASVALFVFKFQHFLQEEMAWHDWPARVLFLVSIPMILHGLYDTFLKKEMNAWALLTALLSFAWFVWRIEAARGIEAGAAAPRPRKKRKPRLA